MYSRSQVANLKDFFSCFRQILRSKSKVFQPFSSLETFVKVLSIWGNLDTQIGISANLMILIEPRKELSETLGSVVPRLKKHCEGRKIFYSYQWIFPRALIHKFLPDFSSILSNGPVRTELATGCHVHDGHLGPQALVL